MKRNYILSVFIFLFLIQFSNAQPCWLEMKGGRSHTVALKADHTLWVWGASYTLGNGATTSSYNPVQVGTGSDWEQFAVGDNWTLAIKSNGTLWAWGSDSLGYLGMGTSNIVVTFPTQVGTDTDWRMVTTGRFHSMAIKTNGTLWGWGQNVDGNIGDGTLINRLVPTQIGTATDWQRIYQGYYHSFGIKTNGTLWGWGWNPYGTLGDGTTVDKIVPTQIGTGTNWAELSGGNLNSLAVKTDGTLWTTGAGVWGQQGNGTVLEQHTWTQMAIPGNFTKVATGVGHNVALTADGKIWEWGLNNAGQIGNGTSSGTVYELLPVQIGTGTTWAGIGVGSHNTFAVADTGVNWAWGNYAANLLGVGLPTGNRLVPTQVNNCTTLDSEDLSEEVNFAKVYPNPVSSTLNIATTAGIYTAQLYDLQGRLVVSDQITATEHQMNISYLTKGAYLLKLTSEDKVQTIKILKD